MTLYSRWESTKMPYVGSNQIRLYIWELESMPEYSSTFPTGMTIWKQWRRMTMIGWVVGQYVPYFPNAVLVRWSLVVLKHGPRPPTYTPPDWNRFLYYERGGFDHGIGYVGAGAS